MQRLNSFKSKYALEKPDFYRSQCDRSIHTILRCLLLTARTSSAEMELEITGNIIANVLCRKPNSLVGPFNILVSRTASAQNDWIFTFFSKVSPLSKTPTILLVNCSSLHINEDKTLANSPHMRYRPTPSVRQFAK